MNNLKPTTHRLAVLLTLISGVASLPGQGTPTPDLTPFTGIWKEDLSQTVRNGAADFRKYQQNADGSLSVTVGAGVTAYHDRFRVDGKPCPITAYPGATQTWTHPDPATWESTVTIEGASPFHVRRTVSTDGAKLTATATYKARNGDNVTNTDVYTRISGEKEGLVGEWNRIAESSDTPDVMNFKATSDGGLSVSTIFWEYKVKPDGKASATNGPFEVSLKAVADRALELTLYSKAKPFETDVLTLSPDGQSISETDRDTETNKQKASMVYRRQSSSH